MLLLWWWGQSTVFPIIVLEDVNALMVMRRNVMEEDVIHWRKEVLSGKICQGFFWLPGPERLHKNNFLSTISSGVYGTGGGSVCNWNSYSSFGQ